MFLDVDVDIVNEGTLELLKVLASSNAAKKHFTMRITNQKDFRVILKNMPKQTKYEQLSNGNYIFKLPDHRNSWENAGAVLLRCHTTCPVWSRTNQCFHRIAYGKCVFIYTRKMLISTASRHTCWVRKGSVRALFARESLWEARAASVCPAKCCKYSRWHERGYTCHTIIRQVLWRNIYARAKVMPRMEKKWVAIVPIV